MGEENQTTMKGHIVNYLEKHDYVKRRELLQFLHSLGVNCSDRAMRKEIESMVKDDGYLIESSEKGYRLGLSESDYVRAVSYLRKKAFPLLERAKILEEGFKKRFNKQLTLDYEYEK